MAFVNDTNNLSKFRTTVYGFCRCCLEEGTHRDITEVYFDGETREVYADIFLNCFNLFLSTKLNISTLICTTCVNRLRDARDFRDLVVKTDQKLMENLQKYDSNQMVLVNDAWLEFKRKAEWDCSDEDLSSNEGSLVLIKSPTNIDDVVSVESTTDGDSMCSLECLDDDDREYPVPRIGSSIWGMYQENHTDEEDNSIPPEEDDDSKSPEEDDDDDNDISPQEEDGIGTKRSPRDTDEEDDIPLASLSAGLKRKMKTEIIEDLFEAHDNVIGYTDTEDELAQDESNECSINKEEEEQLQPSVCETVDAITTLLLFVTFKEEFSSYVNIDVLKEMRSKLQKTVEINFQNQTKITDYFRKNVSSS